MKTILIIEDDNDILDLTSYLLIEAGYIVATSLALMSVAYIKTLNPDLILLDHRLRDGLGNKLCIDIKADGGTNRIPVIMLSADVNIAQIAESSRADAFVAKPFDIDNLLKVINDCLEAE